LTILNLLPEALLLLPSAFQDCDELVVGLERRGSVFRIGL
jgi:hypothetical protein